MEHILHRLQQVLPVVNLDIEFAFDGIVDKDARLDVHIVVLVVPMCLESDRNAIPAVRVSMSESVATDLNDALGHNMRLLIQVDVVLVGVVEAADGAN